MSIFRNEYIINLIWLKRIKLLFLLLIFTGSTEADSGNINSATVKTGTCECQHINKQVNWTQKALDDVLKQLRNDILIPKHSTSKALRKLKCADDGRPSSRTIGYIGIIVLAFLWVLLVLSDILSIAQYIDKRSKI